MPSIAHEGAIRIPRKEQLVNQIALGDTSTCFGIFLTG